MRSTSINKADDALDGWLNTPADNPRSQRIISMSFYSNVVALFI